MTQSNTQQQEKPVVLTRETPVETAVAWAQGGKVDMGVFVAWLCETPIDGKVLVPIVLPTLATDDAVKVICAQGALSKAQGVREGKAQGGGGSGNISFKVGEKGGISVYGLQRQPVTLYIGQWERLLAKDTLERFAAFAKAHASELARK